MSNEDNYFTQKELDKVHAARRQKALEALKLEEKEGIAENLSTSDEVATEALELGFDRHTAIVLPLVPLLEVAWADGKIQDSEREKISEIVKSKNINDASALEFLDMMLETRPSALFFERVNRVVKHIIAEDPNNEATGDILAQCRAVASAAGGFWGLSNPIGSEEQEALDELASLFELG